MTLVRSILIALAILLPASWTMARAEGAPAEKKEEKKKEEKKDAKKDAKKDTKEPAAK